MNDPPFANQLTMDRLALFGTRRELRALVRAALKDEFKHLPIADHICSRLAVLYTDAPPPQDAVLFAIRRAFVEYGEAYRAAAGRHLPASLHRSPVFDQTLMHLAALHPAGDALAVVIETTAIEHFKLFQTGLLTRLAGRVLKRRSGRGIDDYQLTVRATSELKLLPASRHYDPSRSSFETWLEHVLLRPTLTLLRREEGERRVRQRRTADDGSVSFIYSVRLAVPLSFDQPDTADPTATVDARDQVAVAMPAIPLPQREVIGLKDLLGLPWPAVAFLCDAAAPPRAIPADPAVTARCVNRWQGQRSRGLRGLRIALSGEEAVR